MRKSFLAKIHIAKKQLGLDDETYREALRVETGKDSCSKMTLAELESVLKAFKKKGFKMRLNGSKKRLSPSSSKLPLDEINKIRAVFIQMGVDGFLYDNSETALCAFVKRMTKVESVQWLKYPQAVRVLEALKKWHKREMCKVLHGFGYERRAYDFVCKQFKQFNKGDTDER